MVLVVGHRPEHLRTAEYQDLGTPRTGVGPLQRAQLSQLDVTETLAYFRSKRNPVA